MKVLSLFIVVTSFVASVLATSIPDKVTEIQLIDSKTNKVVKSLVNGDVIASDDPAFNLNAIIVGTKTRSVRVAYGTLQNKVNTEGSAPWAYCANKGPLFPKCSRISTYGTHTVFFTPYSRSNAGGDKGTTMSVTFTIEKPKKGAFDITVGLTNVAGDKYKSVFTNAAARWTSIIKNDLPDLDISDVPLSVDCEFPNVLDDVFVCGILVEDPGDTTTPVMGFSVIDFFRKDSNLPAIATIVSNAMLKDDPLYSNLILEQMGQTLGIGWSWDRLGITDRANNCLYSGAKANAEFKAISGCDNAPVDIDVSPTKPSGDRCFFWGACLNRDVMGPNIGSTDVLSRVTIGALEDLGYEVDYSKADALTTADLSPFCLCPSRRGLLRDTLSEGHSDNTDTQGRRLSAAVEAEALAAGQAHLAKNKAAFEAAGGHAAVPAGIEYVGDKYVVVTVLEGGDIYHVRVNAE